MTAPPSSSPDSESVEQAAMRWLARRDRGLTAAEQDEYLQWLRQDPRHGVAMARLDETWSQLDALVEWRPDHSIEPNPQLLAPGKRDRRTGRNWLWGVLSAAMAATAVMTFVILRDRTPAAVQLAPSPAGDGIVRHEPRQMTLPDGTLVRLDTETTVEVAFVPDRRRVILLQGAAHFAVTKDAGRPFIVEAGGVTVRAIGTGFNVARDSDHVAVLVTEGTVSVDRWSARGAALPHEESILVAGQRTVIFTDGASARPVVAAATAAEIAHDLAWQALHLEFPELPLAQVVDEFNRHNQRKLAIGDASTGALQVGGTFRADNVDAFVRLLEAGFRVTATQREDGVTVLTRVR
jgi:transmembrane sensor